MSEFKKTVIKGTLWSVMGQFGSLMIILATNIWLARILSPSEFGQVGVIMFFITISNVFTESGLGGALIRQKHASQEDYSTVFVFNLVLSVFCFLAICLSADYIADFYDDKLIKNLLIVAGVILIINAFQLTQNIKLISELKFKEKAIYRFTSIVTSSVVGIYLAYDGYGVWALVIIQILTSLISTILLWVFEDFSIKFYFSRNSFKQLYSFGINTTIASLLNTGFDNIYQLVLARYFSMAQTGYFYQAKKLQDVPGGIITLLSNSVLFSSLAKLQDDNIAFTKAFNKITLYFLVLLGFISTFVYIYSEPIILLLYGDKWLETIFYMQLLTLASFFYLQENINKIVFKVFNKTKKILYLEYIKKTVQTVSIFVGLYFLDLQILIVGFVLTNIFSCLLNYYYSRKLLYSDKSNVLFLVLKVCALSILSAVLIICICNFFKLHHILSLITVPLLIIFYISGVYFFKIMDIKSEILSVVKIYRIK